MSRELRTTLLIMVAVLILGAPIIFADAPQTQGTPSYLAYVHYAYMDAANSSGYDRFEVFANTTRIDLDLPLGDSRWKDRSANLSAYAGQTIGRQFAAIRRLRDVIGFRAILKKHSMLISCLFYDRRRNVVCPRWRWQFGLLRSRNDHISFGGKGDEQPPAAGKPALADSACGAEFNQDAGDGAAVDADRAGDVADTNDRICSSACVLQKAIDLLDGCGVDVGAAERALGCAFRGDGPGSIASIVDRILPKRGHLFVPGLPCSPFRQRLRREKMTHQGCYRCSALAPLGGGAVHRAPPIRVVVA